MQEGLQSIEATKAPSRDPLHARVHDGAERRGSPRARASGLPDREYDSRRHARQPRVSRGRGGAWPRSGAAR